MDNMYLFDSIKKYSYESTEAIVNFDSNSFIARDMKQFTDKKVIEIESLRSSIQGQGHAKEVLRMIVDDNRDSLIVLKAEPMFASEEEYNSCKDLKSKILTFQIHLDQMIFLK